MKELPAAGGPGRRRTALLPATYVWRRMHPLENFISRFLISRGRSIRNLSEPGTVKRAVTAAFHCFRENWRIRLFPFRCRNSLPDMALPLKNFGSAIYLRRVNSLFGFRPLNMGHCPSVPGRMQSSGNSPSSWSLG